MPFTAGHAAVQVVFAVCSRLAEALNVFLSWTMNVMVILLSGTFDGWSGIEVWSKVILKAVVHNDRVAYQRSSDVKG